jgi:Gas vesicle synthesis protein GvpL/GvpF
VIELYAITDHPTPPLPQVAPLRAVATGDLAAVFAPAGDDGVSADALWRHEAVVEALMEGRDLLPVRYGTRFDDEDAAARAVAARRDDLAAALDRVRGAVELSLRVIEPGAQRAAADAASYLHDRRRREEARRAVHEPLAAVARASVERPSPDPSELLRAAYLVDRGAVEQVTELVARLQAANPTLRLLCTGPWPAYSFAEA